MNKITVSNLQDEDFMEFVSKGIFSRKQSLLGAPT
ncbi:MAG: hypothetical protein ACJAVM_003213 [Sulfitobacter sp.]|jgi:hypothetical protein